MFKQGNQKNMRKENLRNEFFCSDFVQIHPFMSFRITLFKILHIKKKLSSSALFKEPHQWGFQRFNISCWNFVDLKIAVSRESYVRIRSFLPTKIGMEVTPHSALTNIPSLCCTQNYHLQP